MFLDIVVRYRFLLAGVMLASGIVMVTSEPWSVIFWVATGVALAGCVGNLYGAFTLLGLEAERLLKQRHSRDRS